MKDHSFNDIASAPNKRMQLTIKSVTPFAYAKVAPLLLAADPKCYATRDGGQPTPCVRPRAVVYALLALQGIGTATAQEGIPDDLRHIATRCIEQQIKMRNPLLDPSTSRPTHPAIDQVKFVQYPDAGFVVVLIGVSKVYPDAPYILCGFSIRHGDFYRMEYGGEAATSVWFDEFNHNLGISDEEYNRITSLRKESTFPLQVVLSSLSN